MTITEPRVQDSVGAALRMVRENWRGVVTTGAIGALAATAVQIIGGLAPQLPFLTIAVVMALNAMVYAVFVGLALRGGPQGLPVIESFVEGGIERSSGEQGREHDLGDRARA